MVKRNKSPPSEIDLNNALIVAASRGRAQKVRLLIAAGADVNFKDREEGLTALMWAAEKGQHKCLLSLLKAGADINAKDNTHEETALMLAAGVGKEICVAILLTYDADVGIKDKHGRTALDHARRYVADWLSQDVPREGNKCVERLEQATATTQCPVRTRSSFHAEALRPSLD